MPDMYVYSTPKESDCTLTLDSGEVIQGEPCVAHGREDAHRFRIPEGTAIQGSVLHVECSGHVAFDNRGILDPSEPCFKLDDIRLAKLLEPVPEPTPDPSADPLAIINAVYATGMYPLSTHTGCGLFTEACCTALHQQHSADWGHIRKTPGQNQFNSHAVDALMLRWPAGGTQAGIYDIIHDSVSPNASPNFIYKGEPDPNLWYYPADPMHPRKGNP